jgi:hypothetical protein
MKGDKEWCFKNFINVRAMKTVLDTRKQVGLGGLGLYPLHHP